MKNCVKCGSQVDEGDRFCRACGKPQVFVEMAVWKQFLLAFGTLIGLVLVMGTVIFAVEGIDSNVETAVGEAAGGWDAVDSVDCKRSSSDSELEERYRCDVSFYEAPCERWIAVVEPGRRLEAAQAQRSRGC